MTLLVRSNAGVLKKTVRLIAEPLTQHWYPSSKPRWDTGGTTEVSPTSLDMGIVEKAFSGVPRGILWRYVKLGPLLRVIRSLYKWSESLVGFVPGGSWTPPGLPFVNESVHKFYGQNF